MKSLFPEMQFATEYGGSFLKGKRKGKRPITVSKPLHLILKSEIAVGRLSLLRFEKEIVIILSQIAKQFEIKVYKFAINRNHIHLCVKGRNRADIIAFLRAFPGVLAKKLIKKTQSNLKKFWTLRVYSRIVTWGREFKGVLSYIKQNEEEARGFIPYTPRKKRPKKKPPYSSIA